MKTLFVIALGGALGALGRYALSQLALLLWGGGFPYGTLFINVLGSFLIGLGAASLEGVLRAGLLVGFLGAFTTYSTFSLESLRLFENGQMGLAFLYAFATLSLALSACVAGLYLGRLWL